MNLKTKIDNLPKGSLAKVLSLQGVTYNFITDVAEQPKRDGFIAQDLQKLFPDLVVEEKEGLAIKTLEIIPYMIEAIKEQQELINQLQSRIEKLESIR